MCLMARCNVPPLRRDAEHIGRLLDLPEVATLVADLDAARWTGRPGYPHRAMVGMAMVKAVYALPTWTRVVRLVADHAALQRVLGCSPSLDACYRFTRRLREHRAVLDACLHSVVAALAEEVPGYGTDLAIDGSDLPAYANGQRYISKGGEERTTFADPDASWGHRSSVSTRSGGGYYGYKLHLAVCAVTGLPVAWEVATAKDSELAKAGGLLDSARHRGVRVETAALDKGYDVQPVHDALMTRDVLPVIPLTRSTRVKRGEHLPPECPHGTLAFAGPAGDGTRWSCPSGCPDVLRPASRLHPVIPRETERFAALYRGRAAVEREFGRLKHEWGLRPLRMRGLARVAVHADLTILARLATALATTRA